MNLSPQKLIDVWHQLELCYDSKNAYAKCMAELYVYTLCDAPPTFYVRGIHSQEIDIEVGRAAAKNLHAVITMFLKKRECQIKIDNRPFGDWLSNAILHHRCHVKVERPMA